MSMPKPALDAPIEGGEVSEGGEGRPDPEAAPREPSPRKDLAPEPAAKQAARLRTRIWRRARRPLRYLAIGTPLAFAALWYGVHHVPWLGPLLADSLRAVLGDRAVSRLEDALYGAQDSWNRATRSGEAPKAYWDVPEPMSSAAQSPNAPVGASDAGEDASTTASFIAPPFPPHDVAPPVPEVAARGDGTWVAVALPEHPSDPPHLYKTLIHPDRARPWAEVFVIAIDVAHTRLSAVAGTWEPVAETPEGRAYPRKGLVPEAERADLVCAFNGGFKAEHGHLGMRADGVTLLKPRDEACTVVGYRDGSLRIGTWRTLDSAGQTKDSDTTFWRQGPSCIVEGGALHPGLANEASMSWGAALGGDTVVRRSALGLSADHRVLYMGISNFTTARAIAIAMQRAGATDAVQLDINWSFPHLVMFRRDGGEREAFGLFPGFVFDKRDYVSKPSGRDFFYVTRRDQSDGGP